MSQDNDCHVARAVHCLIVVTALTLVSLWADIGISLWNRARIARIPQERAQIERGMNEKFDSILAALDRLERKR